MVGEWLTLWERVYSGGMSAFTREEMLDQRRPVMSKHTHFVTISVFSLLVLAVLWLYREVGLIRLPNPAFPPTLAAAVNTNARNISDLGSDVSANYSNITSLASDVSANYSYIASVDSLASNANSWAHSHGYSDARLKTNVTLLTNALQRVLALRPSNFEWGTDQIPGLSQTPQIGLIAQEVEQIYPELVSIGPRGYKTLDYARLTPVLVAAVQEQQAQIMALETRLLALESVPVASVE